MTIVVDASVAAKWYLQEPGSAEAQAVAGSEDVIAPDLILAEVLNVIWKNVRLKRVTAAQVSLVAEALPRHLAAIVPSQFIASRGGELALALDHPVYDCLYLALAEREKCRLLTANERLYRRSRKTRFAKTVQPLLKSME